jgi:hypothetical protein
MPDVPKGREDVLIATGSKIAIEKDVSATDESVSVTCAVKLNRPAADGVPEITPVDPSRVKPPGRLPDEIAQV